ncbi:HTH domain-containing protein [Candidatus Latescibacterota bacterium]
MAKPADSDQDSTGHTVEDTVLTYAVPPSVYRTLTKVCGDLRVKVYDAENLTDLVAVPSCLMVINLAKVDPAVVEETYSQLLEVAGKDIALLFTNPPPVQPPEPLRRHIVKSPEELDAQTLRFIIIRRMGVVKRHVKLARSYDRKLYRLLFILRAFQDKGFVYSRDLCMEFNVSQRTIARDIELLITMGEQIEYDPRRKGYFSQGTSIGCA